MEFSFWVLALTDLTCSEMHSEYSIAEIIQFKLSKSPFFEFAGCSRAD
jgi:hypothetical protein